jgi:hypothetical protein
MHLQPDLARRASPEPASSHREPAEEAYRHPYGGDRRQTPRRARLAVIDVQDETTPPPQEPETNVNLRLQQIREISNRAIGSIDDLLQRTA